MSAKEITEKRAGEVRIGIPLRAFLRFSQQIDEQLGTLESRVFAAVPQLANRKIERRSTKLR
jgi:hypothetical protein